MSAKHLEKYLDFNVNPMAPVSRRVVVSVPYIVSNCEKCGREVKAVTEARLGYLMAIHAAGSHRTEEKGPREDAPPPSHRPLARQSSRWTNVRRGE
jgi:hypothetical protein